MMDVNIHAASPKGSAVLWPEKLLITSAGRESVSNVPHHFDDVECAALTRGLQLCCIGKSMKNFNIIGSC